MLVGGWFDSMEKFLGHFFVSRVFQSTMEARGL